MQVGYVFLARYAEPNPDGTIDSIGGDFDIVRASAFPTVFPISVVARLNNVTQEDCAANGTLPMGLDVVSPTGASLLAEPFIGYLEPKKVPKGVSATNAGSVRLLMNLGGVPFPEPGRYEVRLQFGEEPNLVKTVVAITAEVSNA